MSRAIRRAAKTIRDQDREMADRGVRELEYADVKRANPLTLEMQGSSLVLDNDDLSLTAWVRAYDAEVGIARGDTAVVKQMRHGVWLVTDVLTPSATATFGGSGIYQPIDSDLTAISALTTASFGRGILETANAAAAITYLGAISAATAASTYQPLDSDLTAIAALTTTAYGRSLLTLADAAAGRTLLGLVIGTNVQAYDAELAAIAGLTSAADRLPYFTGLGTAALATFTAAGRALVDDADAAAQRTTLGLVIGTNVQAYDGDLAAIAGLTSAADKGIQFTGAGTAGTFDLTAAAKTVLDDTTVGAMLTTMGGLSTATAASTYQPLDSDLTAIAALTTTAYGRSVLALADAAAGRALLGLVLGTDVAPTVSPIFTTSIQVHNSSTNGAGLQFGYGSSTYRHRIVSDHNGAVDASNTLNFYLWKTADAVGSVGTNLAFQVGGAANTSYKPLSMSSQRVTDVADPFAAQDAATKTYVDVRTPTYVTSLPGSPYDGQEIYYAADATNGVIWHLRYRSAASGSYKWEYLGGPPMASGVGTSESTTSASFVDIATAGPSIAVPLAGDYDVDVGVTMYSGDPGWYISQVGLKEGAGAAAWFMDLASRSYSGGVSALIQPTFKVARKTLAAQTLKMQYATSGGTSYFVDRFLRVKPVRVG